MTKRIEAYIPKAMNAIQDLNIANAQNEIPKQFNGYIASFGASIRQAGLLATTLFYTNEQSNSEEDRAKVVEAIEQIIGQKILTSPHTVDKKIRSSVEDAAVALKLCIRTYKLV